MDMQKNDVTKFCSFYISDWHLVTMLLPYINKKINEQAEIATILEKNIEENIRKLVEKLNLKNKEKILNLEWNKSEERKNIFTNIEENKEKIIIINGEREFIKRKNEKIKKYLKNHKVNQKIKIINCYEIVESNGNVSDILEENDKILNTSGEKEITEIFENYKSRNEKLEAI
ncbi:MAG: hypothetical protein GX682_05345 [Clostridiaceae bacterium]|nr:hypothetical protein [Clostridiaceae bacterium]